ncbi:nucleotide-diphospho-sugar transferase [Lipomyces starkeyi]
MFFGDWDTSSTLHHDDRLLTQIPQGITFPNRSSVQQISAQKRQHSTFLCHSAHLGLSRECHVLLLVRNSELDQMLSSIREVQDRFNIRFGYDWVFANDKPLTEKFMTTVRSYLTSGTPQFDRAAESRRDAENRKVMHGGSESYRHMSGIKFSCDIIDHPFRLMGEGSKKYVSAMIMPEGENAVKGLWTIVRQYFRADFFTSQPDHNNLASFVTDDGGLTYNLCHFWSNFEIADLDIFRSEQWGNAPVHSIYVALVLQPSEIMFLDTVGYYHKPNQASPHDEAARKG